MPDKRLGYANKKTIEDVMKEELVIGMKKSDVEKKQCEPCVEGKMCKKTHPRLEGRKTRKKMGLWHIDLIGPIKRLSRGELLKEKGDAADQLKKLILLKENQTGQKLKIKN
ncbi:PREDICTED: uncharacterized protein LOC106749489 [Dinoponera quadriceps]|uniref:Uncharacterized protein LOC106749489 n=1 Tax=Dinoponera quadriceps TaxID=609295 RepID=A0A6P3Y0Y5_DINQU|nr:PREDICTED: uncharacterized protein LOC106749489 [Dinoponera quadriceps]